MIGSGLTCDTGGLEGPSYKYTGIYLQCSNILGRRNYGLRVRFYRHVREASWEGLTQPRAGEGGGASRTYGIDLAS
jgi:hypothetical protein